MKFQSASDVRDIVETMRLTDQESHSYNRAKINELFEGFPPFSEDESEVNHFDTNVNFLEAPGLAHKARSTWNNAFLKPGNFFTVTLDSGPKHKRGGWSHTITTEMNKVMKNSLPYVETIRATGAQVIMHGIGPVWWERAKCWRPDEVGIEDLLVPSGTRVKLNNLSHFAIYRKYTPEELFTMTHGSKVDPGWNMKVVNAELKRLATTVMQQQDAYQDMINFEKLVKFYKANSGFLDTDAVPTVDVWDFYHLDLERKNPGWFRKMILDNTHNENDFLYDPDRRFSGDLSQILHIQFGDGANIAPFLYHTVRSLGFLLFGVCHLQNRLRCNFMDAIMRATHEYFRVQNADDRARVQSAQLTNLGLVPNGLEFVPREQRWQVDEALVVAGLSQNRQLMSENAAAFVQDVDAGAGGKELTATEVMARLNNANALVSSLLSMAYTYQKFQYREIARRFTVKDGDRDIQKFRAAVLKGGVPEQYLNIERWEVEPERVMGGGNKTLELAQAKSMMEVKTQFDSSAQREILRDYTLAVTDDPDKADRWVPEEQHAVSPSEHDAQLAVGALMQLAPMAVREGIDHIGYVEAMLLSMKSIVDDIKMIGQPMPTQVVGLMACFKHATDHMKIIAEDEANRQLVKRYGDFLKPIMNQVKAWGQQLKEAEMAQRQQNGDGGKAAAAIMTAQTKNKIAEMSAAKKEQRKDIQFVKEQKRRDIQTMTEAQRSAMLTNAEVEKKDKLAAADIRKKRMTTFAE